MTPFSILIVCTGNICRSPFAERLLRSRLEAIAPGEFTVNSAGTHATPGHPIDPSAARRLDERGVDGFDFTSRRLDAGSIAGHDLILTMTRAQRSETLAVHPAALKRVFTMRELARLLSSVEAEPSTNAPAATRWKALLPTLAANRTLARSSDPTADDVADPYRRDEAAFIDMADQLDRCVETIVDFELQLRAAHG